MKQRRNRHVHSLSLGGACFRRNGYLQVVPQSMNSPTPQDEDSRSLGGIELTYAARGSERTVGPRAIARWLAFGLLLYEGVLIGIAFVDVGLDDSRHASGKPAIDLSTRAALWFVDRSAAIKICAFCGILGAYMAFTLLRGKRIDRVLIWSYMTLVVAAIFVDVVMLALLVSSSPITLRTTGIGPSQVIYSWGSLQIYHWLFLSIPAFVWLGLIATGRDSVK